MHNILFDVKNINKQQKKIIKIITGNMSIPYPIKYYYNSVIPLNIFQTWHTKTLPPLMFNAVNKIKAINPRFKYCL
jgi:mannosyltransferase OCH1-like enzyme